MKANCKKIEEKVEDMVKTMHKVGILWLNSKINPANEHFISENVRIKLCNEINKYSTNKKNKKKWILFLPEGEFHDIGLLYTYLLLKINGHDVIYLGQNVPRESLLSIDCKDNNILFFQVSNKPDNFYKKLHKFLIDNFSNSKKFIISDQKKKIQNSKSLIHISNLNEFILMIK